MSERPLWQQCYELVDEIYATVLKELTNGRPIDRKTIAEMIGFRETGHSAFWPKIKPTPQELMENKPPGLEHAFEQAKEFAARLNRLRGRSDYVPQIQADQEVEPQRYLFVDGIPHRRADGSRFVEQKLLDAYKRRKILVAAGETVRVPVVYVSPVHMSNVDSIISELRSRLPTGTPITDVISAMKLKLMSPDLAKWLERAGLIEEYQEELKKNIKVIGDRLKEKFSLEPDPASAKWLSVHSYWEGLPPIHGMYIQDFDFVHLTPYAPSLNGKLHAWITGSYRLYEKDSPDAFARMRDALMNAAPIADWSWLANVKPPKKHRP